MAISVKLGRFQFQRGKKSDWESSNFILLDGELAIESDTTKMKVGDGRSLYADLPYIEIGQINVGDLSPEEISMIKGTKGDQGDAFTYADFTPEQRLDLKGDKGDAFKYEDFTEEQLDAFLDKLKAYQKEITPQFFKISQAQYEALPNADKVSPYKYYFVRG